MPQDDRVHPESLKGEVKEVELTSELETFVNDLSRDIDTEQTNRAGWEQNIDRYRNLRYGIRKKKTHPWKNAANYVLPLIDSDINRTKPAYINLAFSVSPIVNFEPYGPEDVEPARKREILFDWRMRTKVKFFMPYSYGVDHVLADGAAVFKVIWRYSTRKHTEFIDLAELPAQALAALYDTRMTDDLLQQVIQEELRIDTQFEENVKAIEKAIKDFRAGKSELELSLVEIAENRAQVIARSLRDDVVIPYDTLIFEDNLDDARFIDDKIWMSKNELKIAMQDGKYNEYDDSDIDSWAGKWTQHEKKISSASNLVEEDIVLIHETCCWYDVDGDGIEERCICTWPDAAPSKILRFIELPYDHGQWPYTLVKRELNDPGVYSSRGIAALDEDYQDGVSTALNQAIDNGTIVNRPQVVFRRGTISNIRNHRYIPGEPVETNGPITDYEVRQTANLSQGILFQQAQYLKSWANERLGNVAGGMSATNNISGMGEKGKKTAKEVNLIENLHSEALSLDLQVFQQQMARVYYQIDALYGQFGDDVEEILITNEAPIRIDRREIQGKFNVVPNGRLENTNPMVRAQKALKIKQIYTGVPWIRDYELDKLILNDFDSRLSGKVLRSEQELAQMQQQEQQQTALSEQVLLGKQVDMTRIGNALDIEKELALVQIHGQKFAPD